MAFLNGQRFPFLLVNTGSGGGSTDYNDLDNKPKIGGVTLSGNKTLAQLGAAAEDDIPTALSELSDDSTHRLVTDAEKASWDETLNYAIGTYIAYDSPTTSQGVTYYDYTDVVVPDGYIVKENDMIFCEEDSNTYVVTSLYDDQRFAVVKFINVSGKQDKLTAGANISIVNNVISASGGGGGATVYVQSTEPSNPSQGDIWCDPDEAETPIPTALSDLDDDSTHRLVTDTEKSTWNGKETKGKLTVSGTAYNVTRKALTITNNGVTSTFYVADIT